MVKIYLAGGLRSNWQDRVRESVHRVEFIDPREHQLTDPRLYTFWDLHAIERSEWVFAYLEKDNPGGYALALEIGYAKGLGKRVLLVDEKPEERYFAMVRECADIVFPSLDEGMKYLSWFDR